MKWSQVVTTISHLLYLFSMYVEAEVPREHPSSQFMSDDHGLSANITMDPTEIKKVFAGDTHQVLIHINGTLPENAQVGRDCICLFG